MTKGDAMVPHVRGATGPSWGHVDWALPEPRCGLGPLLEASRRDCCDRDLVWQSGIGPATLAVAALELKSGRH